MYIYKCTHHLSKSYQVNSKLSFNFELRKGEGCTIFKKILFLLFFFNSSFFLGPVNGQRYKLFQQTIKTWDNKVSIKLATAYRPDVLTLNYNYWYKNHSYNFYSNIWTYNNVHCILYDQ